jgi:hypothetical protein
VEEAPPFTVVGFSVNVESSIGESTSDACLETPPALAVMVTEVRLVTA